MTQAFTPELCTHLSSLVPGFEGHWWRDKEGGLFCEHGIDKVFNGLLHESRVKGDVFPAWQVEDVLRNWTLIIQSVEESKAEVFCTVCRKDENKCGCEFFGTESPKIPFGKYTAQKILSILILEGDTAYQKIEEYLWSILK